MGNLTDSLFSEQLEKISLRIDNSHDKDSIKTIFWDLRSLLIENFETTRYSIYYEHIQQGIYRFIDSDRLEDAKVMIKHLIKSFYSQNFQAGRVYFENSDYDLVCHIENLKSAFEINVTSYSIENKMELALDSLLFINKNLENLKNNIHLSNILIFAIKDSRYFLKYDKKILSKARKEISTCYNELVFLFFNK